MKKKPLTFKLKNKKLKYYDKVLHIKAYKVYESYESYESYDTIYDFQTLPKLL